MDLRERMVEERKETTSCVGVCCSVWWIPVFGLVTLTVLALGLAEVVLGALHAKECPHQFMVPIYLIVNGIISVIISALVLTCICRFTEYDKNKHSGRIVKRLCILNGVLIPIMFVWFLVGNVLVFQIYNKYDGHPSAENYCSRKLYNFAFWSIIIRWISTVMYVLLAVTVCCCSGGVGSDHQHVSTVSSGDTELS